VQTVNLSANAFDGSNPSPTTTFSHNEKVPCRSVAKTGHTFRQAAVRRSFSNQLIN